LVSKSEQVKINSIIICSLFEIKVISKTKQFWKMDEWVEKTSKLTIIGSLVGGLVHFPFYLHSNFNNNINNNNL